MKLLTPIGFFLFLSSSFVSAQVGINTTNPQETLHVAGTVRVDNTSPTVTTTKLFGADAVGTLREISVGSNVTLASNVLSVNWNHSFGTITLTPASNNNVDLLLDSGEANEGKSIIRINKAAVGDLEITGIKDGYNGQHIWLYPQSGKLTLKTNDVLSLAVNRIEVNDKPGAKQWGMIELVYDGTRSKWIIMQNHN